MIVIHRPRGMGKTTELIRMAHENGAVIICMDPEYVSKAARQLGYPEPQTMSYEQFAQGSKTLRGQGRYNNPQEAYLDDYDYFLNFLTNGKLKVTKMTTSDGLYQEWNNEIKK
jgi:hypothetical protein